MGIDAANASARARELQRYANQLRSAKADLYRYKSMLNNSWQGTETEYYVRAISDVETRLNRASSELEAIGRVIVSTVQQIEEEESAESTAEEV